MKSKPIAVVGIGCRFAGGIREPSTFWTLLSGGFDAIREVPKSRFDIDAVYDQRQMEPGKIASRFGGFIDAVDEFDAGFFGISPREAAHMDPQSRQLLEVAADALNDSGDAVAAGANAGVFIGCTASDYDRLQLQQVDDIDLFAAVGGSRNAQAARISNAFGFEGPSLVVDSDRSSSLVAIHLACQSLASGECDLALAGGANLILSPELSIAFSRAGLLAPDGRCKFGDASANGFVRADGIGLVVLKPLEAALASRDRIYAVVRGSAVNNDGCSSGDLLTPSRLAQERLLRQAYANAGVDSKAVAYIEAHGTGTPVGDVVELEALTTVISEGRDPSDKCPVGSVKTNIGHAEAAAGVAGFIKVALSLYHRMIPRSLHLAEPNPKLQWASMPLFVVTENRPLAADRPSVAGVSSFGLTGTNAHVVLETAPAAAPSPPERGLSNLLPISAASESALKVMASAYAEQLSASPGSFEQVCQAAATRRRHYSWRVAIAAKDSAEAVTGLSNFLADKEADNVHSGPVSAGPRRVVFVCPGQGSQWFGMGRELLEEEPVFRAKLEECDVSLRRYVDWSVIEQISLPEGEARLEDISVVQPALFAMSLGLAALWQSWGIAPAAVVGTSMGEVAAAYIAGALSLDDAVKVICLRSRLLKTMSGGGAMAIVELSRAETEEVIAGFSGQVSVSVSNSPHSTAISGATEVVAQIAKVLEARSVSCRFVKVDFAPHSPQVDSLLGPIREVLSGLMPKVPHVPMYSTVISKWIDSERLDSDYWAANLREPVFFADAMQRLCAEGHNVFIELSAHPVLWGPVLDCIAEAKIEAKVIPSLKRQQAPRPVMLASLGELYTFGVEVDWTLLYGGKAPWIELTAYPWEHRRFWFKAGAGLRQMLAAAGLGEEETTNPASAKNKVLVTSLQQELADGSPLRKQELLLQYLKTQVGQLLGVVSNEAIVTNKPLRELGLNSLMLVELRSKVSRVVGHAIPATIFFDYPTIAAMSAFLAGTAAVPAPAVETDDAELQAPVELEDILDVLGQGFTEDQLRELIADELSALKPEG